MKINFEKAFLLGTSALVSCFATMAVGQALDDIEGDVIELDVIYLSLDRQGGQVLDQPSNVTVVDEDEITTHNITDMKKLTRYTPGITTSHQTTATDPYSTFGGFNIRGVGGNRVQIQVDGARIPERITDGTRDYLDFSFTKQVEIVRGPASVLWGADALGGVVALETLDPEDVLDGRDSGGSFSTSHDTLNNGTDVDLTYAQKLSPNLELLVGVSRSTANEMELSNARDDGGVWGCPRNVAYGAITCGELDPTDVTATRGLAKLVWTPSESHRLEFTADILDRRTAVDSLYGLGPAYSFATGLPTGVVNHKYDRVLDLSRQRYAVEHQWQTGGIIDTVKTTLSFSPNSYNSTSKKYYTDAAGDSIMTDSVRKYSETFLELDIQATAKFNTGRVEHDMVFGFDGDNTDAERSPFDRTTNLTTGVITEDTNGGFKFANSQTTRADIYLQDKITFGSDRFELTPGLRYATYKIDPKPYADYSYVSGNLPTVREDQKLLKSLGLMYHFDDTYSVWAKYSEGFKMPTAQQLYSSSQGFYSSIPAPNLQPEEVKNVEIGLRGEYGNGFFSINAFQADYTNFIQEFYFIPNTNNYTNRNIQDVTVWGIEASGEYAISDVLSVNFDAAYQKGRQRATPTSAETPFNVSPFSGTIGVAYDIPQMDLTIEAAGTFAASITETSSPTAYKPAGYEVLDLYATWKPSKFGTVTFGVQNVFDRRYFNASAASYEQSTYSAVEASNPIELQTGAGRTFQVSYEREF